MSDMDDRDLWGDEVGVFTVPGRYLTNDKKNRGADDVVLLSQHQRLLEEAKQGQRVLAMDVEQLEAELLQAAEMIGNQGKTIRELQLAAQKVVLPERIYGNPYSRGFNACLDEVERLNGAKP
jgi:hypothetical protein